jgi:cytosine/adenosine deaminase-related metal-dependent hydrolase
MAIILKDATYIDWQTLAFKKTHIKVEEGINGAVTFLTKNTENSEDKIIDCKGKYVTKSFACGHHHAYSALSRGMGAPKKTPENFNEILKYVWWTLDKCLDKEMIEASAYLTAMASAKNGVTFVIDHHASPFAVNDSLEIMAKAFEKVGVSHLLCYEISDRDGLDIAQSGLDETENYLKNNQGLVGLHASFTVSDDTLKKAVKLAEAYKSGIHIHVAEAQSDQNHCLKSYGKRIVQRLNDAGALQFSKTILGHCLHVSDDERTLLKKSPVWIVQNTESNLNNNVGYFNSVGLNENIMLGTDGMHSDMLRSAKAAFFVGQGFDNIDYSGVYKRFRNVHRYIHENNFSGDGNNNLVVLDYDSPTDFNASNFLGHFLFGIESRHVEHVISNGKLIVKNRQIQTVDEELLLKQARKLSKILWKKMQA